MQSGATIRVSTRDRGAALADAVLKELGTDCDGLQKIPHAKILAAMAPASRAVGVVAMGGLDRYDFGLVADGGTDLLHQPFDLAGAGDLGRHSAADRGHARNPASFSPTTPTRSGHGRVTDEFAAPPRRRDRPAPRPTKNPRRLSLTVPRRPASSRP